MTHNFPIFALALCAACSSATSPEGSLTGTWHATGPGTISVQLVLTQTGDTVTGTAVVTPEGANPVQLQVRGQAGLAGSMVCFPEPSFGKCHVQFAFNAADAVGDTLFYWGQFTGSNTLLGDVQSTGVLPFQNIDGEPLYFGRQLE